MVAVDRKAKELQATGARITSEGHRAIAVVGDVSDTGLSDAMVAIAVQRFGGLDLAVNTTGVMDGGNPAYVASKHGVTGLTRNAAIDYAPYGIRVNSVNMAATNTPMVARAGAFVKATKEAGEGSSMGGLKTQSLLSSADSRHRAATVWEQAAVILFLLSADASNLTGGTYATDGGWTAY